MPFKEKEIEKLYYSMGEATQILNLNGSAIRFYEKEFNLPVRRYKNKDRQFSKQDILNLQEIKRLLHEEMYTLKGAQKKFEQFKQGNR